MKLVYYSQKRSYSLDTMYAPIIRKHFDLELFDKNKIYNYNFVVFVFQPWEELTTEFKNHLDNGARFFIDNCWEAFYEMHNFNKYENYIAINGGYLEHNKNKKVFYVHNYFWYNEHYWFTFLGYDKLVLKNYKDTIKTNTFLMPINKQKGFRDALLEKLNSRLEQAIYSVVYRDRYLPGETTLSENDGSWQRYIDVNWFEQTYYSLCVESIISPYWYGVETKTCDNFITEKTCKPWAFKHPYITTSLPNSHSFIKEKMGFEVFDNIFDLGFDKLKFNKNIIAREVESQKIDLLINAMDNINYDEFYSKETQEKLDYNYNRFYNKQLVDQGIEQEIIEPLKEFCESSL